MNDNPYNWLVEYTDSETAKENVTKSFFSYCDKLTKPFSHIGFESYNLSEESLTLSCRTNAFDPQTFFYPRNILSKNKNDVFSSSFITPNRFPLHIRSFPKPVELIPFSQYLSGYRGKISKTILCFNENNVDYISVFDEELKKKVESSNKALLQNVRLHNDTEYLDSIVDFLFKGHKEVRKNISLSNGIIKEILNVVSVHYKDILGFVYKDERLGDQISNKNIVLLEKLFRKKEIVKSFYTQIALPYQQVEKAIKVLVNENLIDKETSIQAFINLFSKTDMSQNKINWTGSKTALFTFIQMVSKNENIKYPKNEHWAIAANSFTLNNTHINRGEFLHRKPIKNKKTLDALNQFLGIMGLIPLNKWTNLDKYKA